MYNVYCVIVTFHPDIKQLSDLMESLHESVYFIIVKNSLEVLADEIKKNNALIIQLDTNKGIAYAQNRGIEKALDLGAEWILLSDQDTVYPPNYVERMISILFEKKLEGVGSISPIFFDTIAGHYSKIMRTKTLSRIVKANTGQIYEIAHNIASGTLIPISTIKKCGLMEERFFIDFVDTEYCWRIIKYGLKNYCISDVIIRHQLGDKLESKFGIKIVRRSLLRFYYIIRNGYYLLMHTDYLKGIDRILFSLLMKKKIVEVLILYNFTKKTLFWVKTAVENGKKNKLTDFKDIDL